MSDPPTPLSMERGGKGKTAIPEEEKADEPSILPMTPESKQLAAVIATAVATAMAGKSASPDSSSHSGAPGSPGPAPPAKLTTGCFELSHMGNGFAASVARCREYRAAPQLNASGLLDHTLIA